MNIIINGLAVKGVESNVVKAVYYSTCRRCYHKLIAHTMDGCKIYECDCTVPCNVYQLSEDEEFMNELFLSVEFQPIE